MLGLLCVFPAIAGIQSAAIALEAASESADQKAFADMEQRHAQAEYEFLVEANEDMVAPSPCRYCGTRSKGVHRCQNCGGNR